MLDTDTKRRIDTARDILVGKVRDPKSQVEQITIALIYKFMDDKDAESEEIGGQRKSFLARIPGIDYFFSLDNLSLFRYFVGRFSGTFLGCFIAFPRACPKTAVIFGPFRSCLGIRTSVRR